MTSEEPRRRTFRLSSEDWRDLRDMAWEWDFIGLGREDRRWADDEYDSVIEQALARLSRAVPVEQLADDLEAFIQQHFEVEADPAQALIFATRLSAWWAEHRVKSATSADGESGRIMD